VKNFQSPDFWTKFHKKVPLFLEVTEFPQNTVWDRSKKAFMPKTGWNGLAVSAEL